MASRAAIATQLRVYDRAGKPCVECGKPIRSVVVGQRSSFYCPHCQKYLVRRVPRRCEAHILSVMLSTSINVPIREGKLALGRWQGVMLVEFDGPRERR